MREKSSEYAIHLRECGSEGKAVCGNRVSFYNKDCFTDIYSDTTCKSCIDRYQVRQRKQKDKWEKEKISQPAKVTAKDYPPPAHL